MQQNKLFTVHCMLLGIWVTLRISMLTIYQGIRGQCTRIFTDKYVRIWANTLLKDAKINFTCHGCETVRYLPNRSYILMSNHTSLYDIPLIFGAIPGSIRMLAKKELFNIPFFGWAMKYAEFVFIDRNNHSRAMQDLAKARAKMESGIVLWLAPEGTRASTKQLLPLKKGGFMLALQTNAIIIPIGIRGAADFLPKGSLQFNTDAKVDIYVGEPIDTAEYTTETRDALMQRVKDQLNKLAGYND